ncbi:D-serine dehydratase 1 [Colletotrichum truncatum]|uniref:D-serine dehydratase 1 n=1 Tax=Colletotrichum truncatum TaxID=5467 RepID=A0ACC3YER8_COLTU|nr:D-serine dehydratase 1 [Colletotrichum truncatum]KAF6783264.1 D-serine dehydratase 1 [Colletotrichum truncatum]
MEAPQRLTPPIEELRNFYVGKDLRSIPLPAVVLDVAKVERHCQSMLNAAIALSVDFRAHVKTHKVSIPILMLDHKAWFVETREIARLQVGADSNDARFIVSTIAEIEHLLPLLRELSHAGRQVNVLYGVPLLKSQVERLGGLIRQLGKESISVLVDHPSQLEFVSRVCDLAGLPAGVYLKVDTGYHRAGLPPVFLNKDGLLERLVQLHTEGRASFEGLYSHSSLSYQDSTADQAMQNLAAEIEGCLEATNAHHEILASIGEFTISVGASPQVSSVENLTKGAEETVGARRLQNAIKKVQQVSHKKLKTKLELHAGVYSVLDMQQMATCARTTLGSYENEVAISVVAEICSVYNNGERQNPEALAAVGTLGLGREPCLFYDGWGVTDFYAYPGSDKRRRLVVTRISQEHSILSWEAGSDDIGSQPPVPFEVGGIVNIYPNHACVTGALYGWYLVVDSNKSDASKIIAVWVRASGW